VLQQPSTITTLEKKALIKAQHSHQRKPSLPRRVRSPEDRIQPFIAITPDEAIEGLGAPKGILTYRYVKPQAHWFPNKEDPLTDPQGLCPSGMLTHTFWQRDLTEPDSIAASTWDSGSSPSLGPSIYGTSGPSP
jgi:hypothetical protein